MDLWIRSQDKQDLMKPKHIKVVGCCIEVSDFDTCLTFASYKTKERALEVLDEIQKRITMLALFTMSQDKLTEKVIKEIRDDSLIVYEMPKE